MIQLVGFTVVVTCVLALLWIAKWWVIAAAAVASACYMVRRWRLEDAQDALDDAAYEDEVIARADSQHTARDAYTGMYGIYPPYVDLDSDVRPPVTNLDEPEPPWTRS